MSTMKILLVEDAKDEQQNFIYAVPTETTQTYTALIRESEGWWIGWILEVPGVTCQERTKNELLDTLQITLREILEDETLEVSRRTESESEAIKASDILEFGVPGSVASNRRRV